MNSRQPDPAIAPPAGLRIAAIIANESISGPGRQLAALAAEMVALSAEFLIVILHRRGHPHPPFAEFLENRNIAHAIVEDRGPVDTGVVRRVRSLLADFQPSLIQTHGYKATAVALALRVHGRRRPWVGFFHGETHENLKARFYHWLDHRMLARADRIVVMSNRQRQRFAHLCGKATVIYNAVIPEPPAGFASPPLNGLPDRLESPVLGVVGRLSPEKGVAIFLEACAILKSRGRSFSALIAGEGPESGRLLDRSRSLGLESHVHFLGKVQDMSGLYRSIDVLVIPSLSEGLPNVLLEAIGADRPVLATDVGAIAEVLADPLAGLVVPPGSPTAIADAVAPAFDLLHSPAAAIARATTATTFSLDARVQRHLQLYRSVLHTAPRQVTLPPLG